MRKKISFSLALFFIVGLSTISATDLNKQPKAKTESARVMTCNIRITGLPNDEVDGRRWEDRRDICIDIIRSKNPDIFCLQEVIYDSHAYFKEKFSDYFGFGFEGPEMDPFTEGYHFIGKNVIFFSKERYEMVSAGCYWLSETPTIGGSISWNSMRARHCNWMRLKDKQTGKEFRVLNLHLDHKTTEAKRKQTEMVVEDAAQYDSKFPQILCGDFNSGYLSSAIGLLRDAGWKEMYETTHGIQEAGFTGHAFQGVNYSKGSRRIDFIFYRGGVKCAGAEIIRDQVNGIYPSDHFFMMADFVIE